MATLTDLFMVESASQWDHSNIRLGLAKLEGSADDDMQWSDIDLIAATGSYDLDIEVQNGQAVLEYEHDSFTVSNWSDDDPIQIDALVLYRFVSGTSPNRLIVVEPISTITIPPRADDGDGGTITYTAEINAKLTVEVRTG